MSKAADKTSTPWILLRDAKDLVIRTCEAPSLAERMLIRWLEAGEVQWRCLGLEGRKQDFDPGEGDAEFWQVWREVKPGIRIGQLEIFWSESWARRNGQYGYAAYRIELAKTDLDRLLPSGAEQTFSPVQKKSPRSWLVDEVGQRRAAGNVPEGRGALTRFSRQLAEQMAKAVDVTHPLASRSIENRLREFELWTEPKRKSPER